MIHILLFMFVMVVTAVLFGTWVVATIGKLIWRTLTGRPRPMISNGMGRQCMNPGCRSGNPMHARYCRRCGSNLNEPITMRRGWQPQPRYNPTDGRGRQVAQI